MPARGAWCTVAQGGMPPAPVPAALTFACRRGRVILGGSMVVQGGAGASVFCLWLHCFGLLRRSSRSRSAPAACAAAADEKNDDTGRVGQSPARPRMCVS